MTDTVSLESVAETLARAEADRIAVPPVRDLFPPRDLDSAYRVQEINIRRRERAGAVRSGRKVGLTSPAVQRQFGVDEPDYGVLLAEMERPDGGGVDLDTLIHPKVEAEIAFELAEDITDAEDPDAVRRAVAHARPSLEIVDCRIRDYDISIIDTIADNAACAGYVLGGSPVPLDGLDLPAVTMALTCEERVVSEGTGANCLGDPLHALRWLAAAALARGRPLRAGETVLSGALGPLVVLEPDRSYTAVFDGLGTVSITATRSGGTP